jgi:hypothetical protein
MQRGCALLKEFVCTRIRLAQEFIYGNESEFEDRHIDEFGNEERRGGKALNTELLRSLCPFETRWRNGTPEMLVTVCIALFRLPRLGESIIITCIALVHLSIRTIRIFIWLFAWLE